MRRARGTLPSLIGIGAMGCGTTSLYHYLRWHPEIHMAVPKELSFFVDGWNWDRGVDWYRSHFSASAPVNGELSPLYATYPEHRDVPERMHRLIPSAKLLYLVRDPIERMLTHYVHWVAFGMERRPCAEALTSSHDNRYLERSRYWTQLKQFLRYFPAEQILVVRSEDLASRRRQTLRRIFAFAGVDPSFWTWKFAVSRHASRRKRRTTRAGEHFAASVPIRWLRRIPHRLRWPVEETLLYPFSRPIPRPVLSPDVRSALWERLHDEVNSLCDFLGVSPDSWFDPTGRRSNAGM